MKRLILALLAISISFPVCANATKLNTSQVYWHSNLAAYHYAQGDSISIHNAYASGEQPIDTTGTIDIRKYQVPPATHTSTVNDTTGWLRVDMYRYTEGVTAGGDTAHVKMQVSADGKNWVSATVTHGADALGTTGEKKAVLVTGTGYVWVIAQELGAANSAWLSRNARGGTVEEKEVYGWPYLRFLIHGDYSGEFALKVTGFVADDYNGP